MWTAYIFKALILDHMLNFCPFIQWAVKTTVEKQTTIITSTGMRGDVVEHHNSVP